jgi:two-component system NtrC family sensor kinase
MMKHLTLFLLLLTLNTFAQKSAIFPIDSLGTKGVLLNKGWKYQTGDNPDWAKPDFNDSTWKPIDPTKDIATLPEVFNAQIKWLRLHFEVKNKLPNPLGIAINQAGASEIYLNGHLIHQFGHIDTDSTKVKAHDPLEIPIYFPADSVGQYHLAVRYALQPTIRYTNIYSHTNNRLFNATLLNLVPTLNAQRDFRIYYIGLDIFKMGVFFMLFVLHLAFYFYQKSNKTHLILAICFLTSTLCFAFKIIGQGQFSVEYRYFNLNLAVWVSGLGSICMYNAFYRMAKVHLDMYYYALVVLQLVAMFVPSFTYGFPWEPVLILTVYIFSFILMFRLTRIGLKKGIKGFFVLGVAIMLSVLGLICLILAVLVLNYSISPNGEQVLKYGISPYLLAAVVNLGIIAIPVGLSLFMGIEGNEINKALSKQLVENEQLKNEAIEHEQEKQQILATQNETLEKQVTERTSELKQSLNVLQSTQTQLIQKEKLASLGELTAGIAHEIQNPLNFVNNFSEVSAELVEELEEEQQKPQRDPELEAELLGDLKQNLHKINHHGKRASSIVKGMLEHSRTGTGERQLTDINQLADEYLRLSYHGLRAKDSRFNIDYELITDNNLPNIEVVPQEIGRVLLNLINNAFYTVNERAKQGEPNYQPKVTVTTKAADNHLEIRVADNGTGIPENIKAKIFQPFFTTKPTGEGTGLGLSLAYDIVTKGHGGTMEIESVVGEGTTFIVKLPIQK